MAGMSLLMEDEPLPPDPLQLNRAASSKYSQMVEEEYRYCTIELIQSKKVASRCESWQRSTWRATPTKTCFDKTHTPITTVHTQYHYSY